MKCRLVITRSEDALCLVDALARAHGLNFRRRRPGPAPGALGSRQPPEAEPGAPVPSRPPRRLEAGDTRRWPGGGRPGAGALVAVPLGGPVARRQWKSRGLVTHCLLAVALAFTVTVALALTVVTVALALTVTVALALTVTLAVTVTVTVTLAVSCLHDLVCSPAVVRVRESSEVMVTHWQMAMRTARYPVTIRALCQAAWGASLVQTPPPPPPCILPLPGWGETSAHLRERSRD
ncbi:uncharacterized protein LOC119878125 [Canis lupus familiaris]|uniref:uncharacterized protein LOC119878125 n=1 Tax=Canis lupus familiaris TaxID=9615 RepID=UPI0018F3CBB6|nr:uncharacterized protein LOC119878125 [Canis lupus familiaris]